MRGAVALDGPRRGRRRRRRDAQLQLVAARGDGAAVQNAGSGSGSATARRRPWEREADDDDACGLAAGGHPEARELDQAPGPRGRGPRPRLERRDDGAASRAGVAAAAGGAVRAAAAGRARAQPPARLRAARHRLHRRLTIVPSSVSRTCSGHSSRTRRLVFVTVHRFFFSWWSMITLHLQL